MKNTLVFSLLLGGAVAVGLVASARRSTADASSTNDQKPVVTLSSEARPRAAGYNAMGLHLLQQLAPSEDKNLCLSPYSISAALAMLSNGAAGTTQAELQKLLGSAAGTAPFNSTNENLRQSLMNADPKVQILIANSLWTDKKFAVLPQFDQESRKYFAAEVVSLNMNSPAAKERVNGWVSDNTKGKIPTIVQDTAGLDALLVNAVYFKGVWQRPFDKALTQDAPFHTPSGDKTAPFMQQSGRYSYLRGDGFQLVALPYASGRLQAWLLLPDKDRPLAAFVKNLDAAQIAQWQQSAKTKQGTVKLPRFKFEWGAKINEQLKALGLASAFGGGANFSRLSAAPTFIDFVIHKTFIEVNEEGTEAAAATAIGMKRGARPNPEAPFEFTADRPFLMLVQDSQSGAWLFVSRVNQP